MSRYSYYTLIICDIYQSSKFKASLSTMHTDPLTTSLSFVCEDHLTTSLEIEIFLQAYLRHSSFSFHPVDTQLWKRMEDINLQHRKEHHVCNFNESILCMLFSCRKQKHSPLLQILQSLSKPLVSPPRL